MTHEEAKKYFEHRLNCGQCGENTTQQKAFEVALDCINKQIPKKPVKTDLWEMCPTCYEKFGFDFDILVGMRGLKTGLCYCLNCGQRIADSEAE